jgi:tRNA uridine 5-carbamoylmethylation protein Kti12
MLIITCGLPSSGKSKAIDILAKHKSYKWHIIRPSDWVPDNLSTLDEQTQREYNIGCWSMALEKCREAIIEVSPKEIIVLDACNSKINTLLTLIADAKTALHRVVLLFIQSNADLCLARDTKLVEPLVRDYVERFKASLPKYKKCCDMFLVVRNNGNFEQLETELYDTWKTLCPNI